MLDLLVQYAKTYGLVIEPGFAPKTVRWAIFADSTGAFQKVMELGETEQKKNPGENFPRCPDLSQMELVSGTETKCHFLIETAEVVALYGENAGDPKTVAKHAYFIQLLRGASSVMPELRPFAELLENPATLDAIRTALADHKAKPAEKTTLAVYGRQPRCLVESGEWVDWWRQFRAKLKPAPARRAKAARQMRCLITGDLVQPVPTHLKILGLANVGGLPTGDVVVGYDKDAFQSYGLDQGANGAVSEEAMAAYRAALNSLIRETGQRLAGAKVVHWFKTRVRPEDDLFKLLEESAEDEERNAQQRAKELLESIRAGDRPDLAGNQFYALTVSGAAGRVMLRDWMEGGFEQLVASICAWFDDLAICHRAGGRLAPPPKFMAVLGATVRDLKELPPAFVAKMWRVAVCNEPIPQQAIANALQRAKGVAVCSEPIPQQALAKALQRVKVDVIQANPPNHAGMGLLKAYHVRKGDREMKAFLNEDHPEPAYHCGRLMAMYARVQYKALGDVGAGVIQRYYAAAITTPGLRLGQIDKLSKFHLDKIERPLARWYENKIAAIWATIEDRVPPTLSLEEQSLFALGYYQQLAADRTKDAPSPNPTEEKSNG